VYAAFEQAPLQTYSVVIDSNKSAADLSSLLRASINTIDRGQPFGPFVPISEYLERNLSGSRFQAELLSLFAAVALTVAAAGLYALLTSLVSGARREWAVRLALGASESDLLRLVLQQSTLYALLGAGLGTALFLISGFLLQSSASNISVWDPILIVGCGAVMIMVSILAAMIPALNAGRISPIEAIRN
jgi:putative ABC transport system permease protein